MRLERSESPVSYTHLEKALEIASTGANVISGSDQACLMNIAGMLDRLHKEGDVYKRQLLLQSKIVCCALKYLKLTAMQLRWYHLMRTVIWTAKR